MQNTIIREFEENSEVVAVIFDQGGANGETRPWLEAFWTNYFLRGGVIWDESGSSGVAYGQPNTGLPFGRGFIIDRDGKVALPYFGHQPQMAIEYIREMLGASGVATDAWSEAADPPVADPAGALRPRGSGIRIVSLHPNPVRDRVMVSVDSPHGARFLLDLFDASGRRVGGVELLPANAGVEGHRVSLDEMVGRRIPSGAYLLRPRGRGGMPAALLLVVR